MFVLLDFYCFADFLTSMVLFLFLGAAVIIPEITRGEILKEERFQILFMHSDWSNYVETSEENFSREITNIDINHAPLKGLYSI